MVNRIIDSVFFLCAILTSGCHCAEESLQGQCQFGSNVNQKDLQSFQSLIGQRFSAGDAEEHGIQYDVGLCIPPWPEAHLPPEAEFQTAGIIRHLKHPQPGQVSNSDNSVSVLGTLQGAALHSEVDILTLEYTNDQFSSCQNNDVQKTVINFHCSPYKSLMSLIKWQVIVEEDHCFLQFDLHHKAGCSTESDTESDSNTLWIALAITGLLVAVVAALTLVLLVLRACRRRRHDTVYRYSQFTTGSDGDWKVKTHKLDT